MEILSGAKKEVDFIRDYTDFPDNWQDGDGGFVLYGNIRTKMSYGFRNDVLTGFIGVPKKGTKTRLFLDLLLEEATISTARRTTCSTASRSRIGSR